jgi:hypothetical protein
MLHRNSTCFSADDNDFVDGKKFKFGLPLLGKYERKITK